MVNFDTLAHFAIQRFYGSIDSGRMVTAYGVVKSFAIAFNQMDIVNELKDAREDFKKRTGMDMIDVVSLGLFSADHTIEFEMARDGKKPVRATISGYDIYKYLLDFQMQLQELFDRAMIQSMRQTSETTEDDKTSELLASLGDAFDKG